MKIDKLVKATIQSLEQLDVASHQEQQQQQQQHYQANTVQCATASGNPPGSSGTPGGYSKVAYPGHDGRLVYPPYNDGGDRLFDFSSAGYKEGYEPLPGIHSIPVVMSLDPLPGGQDDADRIQQAINSMAERPLVNGFRGALRLNRGAFHVGHPLEITASGIVLQGDPNGGTVIVGTTSPFDTKPFLSVHGQPNTMGRGRCPIVDDVIPVGHNQVRVRDRNRFKVGDTVLVAVAFNEAFIKDLGMDVIMRDGKNCGWKPGRYEHYRRVVRTDDEGHVLTLNAPLTTRLEQKYGGGFVQSYESHRLSHVGIQYLEFVFPANQGRGPEEIMKHQKTPVMDYRFAQEMFDHLLLRFDHVEHSWVRHVRSVWWRNFATIGTNTINTTFQHCQHTFHQPPPPPGSKTGIPLAGQFGFLINGQMILLDHCHAEHSFHSYTLGGRITGPNVIYMSSCVAKNGDVGPHMRWSSGQLYDNCNVEGQLIIQDRFSFGTGHGWSGANCVVWNSIAHNGMIIQKPPLAQNFQIGCSGPRGKPRRPQHEWGYEESPNHKVFPLSLYEAQLSERRQRAQHQT